MFSLSETGAVLLSNLPLVNVVRGSAALRRDAQVPQLPRGRSHHARTHQVHEATGESFNFSNQLVVRNIVLMIVNLCIVETSNIRLRKQTIERRSFS